MIVKFKDGRRVEVTDCEGCSKEDIIAGARKALKDAELGRNINTGISAKKERLKRAYEEADDDAVERELRYLERDLNADEMHENYPSIYKPATIKAIITAYKGIIDIMRKNGDPHAEEFEERLNTIAANWKFEGADRTDKGAYAIYCGGNRTPAEFRTYREAYEAARIMSEDKSKNYDIVSNSTGVVITTFKNGEEDVEELIPNQPAEDTKCKDVPYYEPTENPAIKSDYSIERVLREIRHAGELDVNLAELNEVYDEIKELTAKGREVITAAGWSKSDARYAIDEHYNPIIAELVDAGLTDLANNLKERVTALKKAWHLIA